MSPTCRWRIICTRRAESSADSTSAASGAGRAASAACFAMGRVVLINSQARDASGAEAAEDSVPLLHPSPAPEQWPRPATFLSLS